MCELTPPYWVTSPLMPLVKIQSYPGSAFSMQAILPNSPIAAGRLGVEEHGPPLDPGRANEVCGARMQGDDVGIAAIANQVAELERLGHRDRAAAVLGEVEEVKVGVVEQRASERRQYGLEVEVGKIVAAEPQTFAPIDYRL